MRGCAFGILCWRKILRAPGEEGPWPPPQSAREGAGSLSGRANVRLVRQRSENDLLKGKVALLVEQVRERDAQLAAVRGERQRADALLKQRDAQLLAERSAAARAEAAWRTWEMKLLDELEAARWQRGTKRTAPEALAVPEGVAEDKAWLKGCAVELRTGLQQVASATGLLEDSLKRVDR